MIVKSVSYILPHICHRTENRIGHVHATNINTERADLLCNSHSWCVHMSIVYSSTRNEPCSHKRENQISSNVWHKSQEYLMCMSRFGRLNPGRIKHFLRFGIFLLAGVWALDCMSMRKLTAQGRQKKNLLLSLHLPGLEIFPPWDMR